MGTRSYLLSITTAAALGMTAGLTGAGIMDASAIPYAKSQSFNGVAAPALQNSIESGYVVTKVLQHAKNQLGLSGDDALTAADLAMVKLWWDAENKLHWLYRTDNIDGSWTPQAAQ